MINQVRKIFTGGRNMAEKTEKNEQQNEIQIQILEQNSKGEVTRVNVPDEVIIGLPRVEHGCAGMYPRVVIGGKKYTLGSHFYNAEERKARNDYYKVHRGTGGSGSASETSDEVNKKLDEFLTWTRQTLAESPELLAAFEERIKKLRPADRQVAKAKAMIDGFTPEQLAALKAMLG